MQTKLTLRLDDALIARAKEWAREHDVSLSEAVASFFAQLDQERDPATLSRWTWRLAGAGRRRKTTASDRELREEYLDHLERKHR